MTCAVHGSCCAPVTSPTPRASCPPHPTWTTQPHLTVLWLALDPGVPAGPGRNVTRGRRPASSCARFETQQGTPERWPATRSASCSPPTATPRRPPPAYAEAGRALRRPRRSRPGAVARGRRAGPDPSAPAPRGARAGRRRTSCSPGATGSAYAVAHALRTVAATAIGDGRIALLREARPRSQESSAERLAAQVDTDLAVLITLQDGAGAPRGGGRAAPRRRGVRRARGPVPAAEPGPPPAQRLGEKPRRIRSETLAKLTASEQRAARMAASGLTNRADRRRDDRDHQGGRVAPVARLPQARHPQPHRAGRAPWAPPSDAPLGPGSP